ncbi:hypothetical protein POF51_26315 [Brevibacillus sp. AG]|uniref:hypothetical protein n=1 Tax=Brevibacillus sp. AG TaxID=3020891 RepID=UPI00232C163D|nr:hypothetical protein [Brevibacillus sp. AG]MDC0764238.1 hypothetical protein [Brevibacillus sp. AG]
MFSMTFGKVVAIVFSLMFITYVFTDFTPAIAGDPNDANKKSLKKEVTENMWEIVPK